MPSASPALAIRQEYICPSCKETVSALEIAPEMMDMSGDLLCQTWGCGQKLVEVDNSAETKDLDERRAELRSKLCQFCTHIFLVDPSKHPNAQMLRQMAARCMSELVEFDRRSPGCTAAP